MCFSRVQAFVLSAAGIIGEVVFGYTEQPGYISPRPQTGLMLSVNKTHSITIRYACIAHCQTWKSVPAKTEFWNVVSVNLPFDEVILIRYTSESPKQSLHSEQHHLEALIRRYGANFPFVTWLHK